MFGKLLSVVLLAGSVLLASAGEVRVEKGIGYRSAVTDDYAGKMCVLDIAVPEQAAGCPVIVWFHGGGLTSGSRELPQALLNGKNIVVGVEYRLSPKVSTEQIVDDAAAAVAWTFNNISKYGGDTTAIYVAGHSAGGYLTSMIGLDKSYLEKYGIDADRIAGLIPFSGQAITHFETRRHQGLDALQPTIDKSAPLYHVRKDCAPMLIISGDRELELYGRYEEQAYFWRMLKLVGHPDVTLYELDGYDHGGMAQPGFPLLLRFVADHERIRR